MRFSKLAQHSAIVTLLIAASVLYAVAAKADQDTFLNGPDDTFQIDQDGPDQDKKYDNDDPRWDELDDLDHDDDQEERPRKTQSKYIPIHRIETFLI